MGVVGNNTKQSSARYRGNERVALTMATRWQNTEAATREKKSFIVTEPNPILAETKNYLRHSLHAKAKVVTKQVVSTAITMKEAEWSNNGSASHRTVIFTFFRLLLLVTILLLLLLLLLRVLLLLPLLLVTIIFLFMLTFFVSVTFKYELFIFEKIQNLVVWGGGGEASPYLE